MCDHTLFCYSVCNTIQLLHRPVAIWPFFSETLLWSKGVGVGGGGGGDDHLAG